MLTNGEYGKIVRCLVELFHSKINFYTNIDGIENLINLCVNLETCNIKKDDSFLPGRKHFRLQMIGRWNHINMVFFARASYM